VGNEYQQQLSEQDRRNQITSAATILPLRLHRLGGFFFGPWPSRLNGECCSFNPSRESASRSDSPLTNAVCKWARGSVLICKLEHHRRAQLSDGSLARLIGDPEAAGLSNKASVAQAQVDTAYDLSNRSLQLHLVSHHSTALDSVDGVASIDGHSVQGLCRFPALEHLGQTRWVGSWGFLAAAVSCWKGLVGERGFEPPSPCPRTMCSAFVF